MRAVWRILEALLLIVIYTVIAPVWIPIMIYEYRIKKCPRCGRRGGMRSRNFIKATGVTPEGKRYPDSWSYDECVQCGAKLKHIHDKYIDADEEEWNQWAYPEKLSIE